MKFNLKNRPKRKIPIVDDNTLFAVSIEVYDSDEVDEWFEGLEKQEREKNRITAVKIQELGDAKQIPLEQLGFLRGYLQRGKEILGERAKS